MFLSRLLVVLLLFFPTHFIHAQVQLAGTILDAVTGETLPAANIQIEHTHRGTISNAEGRYQLQIDQLPATLLVYYIGYATARIPVSADISRDLDIRLEPVVLPLPELVVGPEDPAVGIMRMVIERKQEWWGQLESYRAEAYGRLTLSNDTGIVFLTETIADAYWQKGRGLAEVVRARKQTENLPPILAMPVAGTVSNLYDDEITVGGNRLIGVTHPDALSVYDFRLTGRRMRDDQIVYDIAVEPVSQLATAFSGRVSVLDDAYALIDVSLQPARTLQYPPPVRRFDVSFHQQFSNYGGTFWLPVDFRFDGHIDIGMPGFQLPGIHIAQIARIGDYQVNIPISDTLFATDDGRNVHVDSLSVREGTLLEEAGRKVPLLDLEELAYRRIDSTMTIPVAFKPTGVLSRFVRISVRRRGEEGSPPRRAAARFSLSPLVWSNRVDQLHLGLRTSSALGDRIRVHALGGYATGTANLTWGTGITADLARSNRDPGAYVSAEYRSGSEERISSALYNRTLTSPMFILGSEDYFDYFRNDRLHLRAGYRFAARRFSLTTGLNVEQHRSLEQTMNGALLSSRLLRPNPPIDPGSLRSLVMEASYAADAGPPLIRGRRRLALHVEHSDPGLLQSDFDFTRYGFELEWRFPTFFQRRFLSNTLDLKTVGSIARGTLPRQRFGSIDGALGPFSPAGAFRSLHNLPYEGERHVALFWEHNFRSVPFELLGWHTRLGVILHGGHGRTWIAPSRLEPAMRYQDGFHHEVGVSLNGILNFLRLDLTKRIDRPGVHLGLSVARMF